MESRIKQKKGFTIVELLVALVLLGTVALVATGFIIPLQVTRGSAVESQAVAYARTYIEIVKSRWVNDEIFRRSPDWGLPTVGTTAGSDIVVPAGWTITVAGTAAWTVVQNVRTVTVTVTPATVTGGRPLTISTIIAAQRLQ